MRLSVLVMLGGCVSGCESKEKDTSVAQESTLDADADADTDADTDADSDTDAESG